MANTEKERPSEEALRRVMEQKERVKAEAEAIRTQFPFVVRWGAYMGSDDETVAKNLAQAAADNAPRLACFRLPSGTWLTVDSFTDPQTLKGLGLETEGAAAASGILSDAIEAVEAVVHSQLVPLGKRQDARLRDVLTLMDDLRAKQADGVRASVRAAALACLS